MSRSRPSIPADRAHLVRLLRARRDDVGAFSFATEETLEVARALLPAEAADAVSSVLAGYAPGGDRALAARAAHVAHELGLEGAIPALVSCVARLRHGDPVADVACCALQLLGRAATEPLLEALARATTRDVRFGVGVALTLMPADDHRADAALESMLGHDPAVAAELLGHRGKREALPALGRALDDLALPAEDDLERLEAIVSTAEAIRTLEGQLTAAQRERYRVACARIDALTICEPAEARRAGQIH